MKLERAIFVSVAVLAAFASPAAAQQAGVAQAAAERPATEATRIGNRILLARGFGNTFLVRTDDGVVIIDTSSPGAAPAHKALLRPLAPGPVRAIILTHGHGDHTGGVALWREPGTKMVAQANYPEFQAYQTRLAGFYQRRNAAQFGGGYAPASGPGARAVAAAREVAPDTLVEKTGRLEIGGLTFEVLATPGETPDHASVWIPQLKAAFVGDNYYESFPNMYTLRGTRSRPALDYVASLDRILALKPEVVLPSHGPPVEGAANVQATLTRYRDAILYVHDAVVAGMNAGKDVHTLMREVKFPPALAHPESYGALAWTVRGIYEGYAGWFDGDVASMYATSPNEERRELARLAGGAGPVTARAEALLAAGQPELALRLTTVALAGTPDDRGALQVRRRALQALLARSANSNEAGWLRTALAEAEAGLR